MLASDLLGDWPLASWQHRRVLVGVSGGADSVALLCAFRELVEPERLIAAHYNHGWRGPASDADEAFVVHLCRQLGVECLVEHAPATSGSSAAPQAMPNQIDSSSSVVSAMLAKAELLAGESSAGFLKSEEAARNARYRFFIYSAYQRGASYVATAHTADDRVETLLHNLFRGSGLAGATSLKMFRQLDQDLVLVRPLIAKSRKDVLQYLAARQQAYCTDASNSDERYARNYIRQQVLPAVRGRYADVDANLLNFSELVEEALGDIRQLAERWLADSHRDWEAVLNEATYANNPVVTAWRERRFWGVSAAAAADQPWLVVREGLRQLWLERGWPLGDMSRRHWESLRGLIQSSASLPAINAQAQQTLAVLPGALVVETAGGYIAIGRR